MPCRIKFLSQIKFYFLFKKINCFQMFSWMLLQYVMKYSFKFSKRKLWRLSRNMLLYDEKHRSTSTEVICAYLNADTSLIVYPLTPPSSFPCIMFAMLCRILKSLFLDTTAVSLAWISEQKGPLTAEIIDGASSINFSCSCSNRPDVSSFVIKEDRNP